MCAPESAGICVRSESEANEGHDTHTDMNMDMAAAGGRAGGVLGGLGPRH